MIAASTAALSASSIVAGANAARSSVTGLRVRSELCRSPVARRPM
jgi:hypothetical protein